MAASATDKFKKAFNSGNPNVARVNATRTTGATTLSCDNLAGWPTDTGVAFSTYKIDTTNKVIAGTQIDWSGVVTGNTIGSLTRITGAADSGSAIGDVVEMNPTGKWATELMEGLLVQHNQDGTHGAVTATTVVSAGSLTGTSLVNTGDVQLRSTSIETIRTETMFDYVANGTGVWSGDSYGSTRNASMTALTCYINGQRGVISAVTARTFTASKDTYIDVLNTAGVFTLVYTEVANNAASPALAANSLRLGIIITGASNIAAASSINQGQEDRVLPIISSAALSVTDSLGNLICPRDPSRKILGYQQILTNFTSTTVATAVDITGLNMAINVPSGRKVRIKAFASHVNSSESAGNSVEMYVRESSTTLGTASFINPTANYFEQINPECLITPSAGVHTYKASIFQGAAGTVSVNGATGAPVYLIAELV